MSRDDGSGGRGGRGRRRRWGENGFEDWEGGYMGAKIAKLGQQFAAEADEQEGGIFEGVAIFVNGYTDPPADELRRIMMMNGGVFHQYFSTRKTTHTIATNLPDTKVKALKGDEPICSPKWIVDSLAEGRLLDFRNYLLYSTQSKVQPKINFLPIEAAKTKAEDKEEVKEEGNRKSLDANDSRFLGEYYNNSRLHHISSMGASFKLYIKKLREKSDGIFPKRNNLRPSEGFTPITKKVLMHIDMDCFFVSVGLRKRPDLVGKPVAVAHAKGARPVSHTLAAARKAEMQYYDPKEDEEETASSDMIEFSSMSELASVSYEARAKGVKNGMFLGAALKLCPDLKTIPYDFQGYQDVALALYNSVAQYTLDIQAVSCDEMMVDITNVLNCCRVTPADFCEHLRNEIYSQTQCRASVGLGSSLLLARMATRKAKPDGCFQLLDEEAEDFMKEVPVRDLPGVGWKTGGRLREMKIEKCSQLQDMSLTELKAEFGVKTGESFYRFCRGIDDRQINLCQERKSVSAEVNYGIRFKSPEDCSNFFDQLTSEVHSRMEKLGVKGKTVTVKLMVRSEDAPRETSKFMGHGIADSVSKSSNFSTHTNDVAVIKREVKMLLRQLNIHHEEMRGVGIQISKLEGGSSSGTAKGTKSILSFMKKVESPQKVQKKEEQPTIAELSFSQLDQDVFSSLPDDIRLEVEAAYGKGRRSPAVAAAAGPSTSKAATNLQDVTFSQVDPEYLAALPLEMQDELRQGMSKRPPPTETAFEKMMLQQQATLESPVKVTPTKGRKRGRPPKNSPRFIKKSTERKDTVVPKALVFEEVVATDPPKEISQANLEESTDLDEVRALLKQWLLSTSSAPTKDDVQTVSEYFQDLVRDRSLDQLLTLVRLLRRRTESMSEAWKITYRIIVENVQLVMIQNYGYPLMTDFGGN